MATRRRFIGMMMRQFHCLKVRARRITMPHVQITWVEGRSPEQKRKIAEEVTQTLEQAGRAKRENIHVVFVDLPATNYAEAGVTVADQKRAP
jgi:4-oxalocrotonate tautomerase